MLGWEALSGVGRFAMALTEVAWFIAIMPIAIVMAVALERAWTADGYVIEAFNVPVSLSQRGLTGEVFGHEVLDHISRMEKAASHSVDKLNFQSGWSETAHVEIPEVGLSLTALEQYLASLRGNQVRVRGEIVQMADRRLEVTVRVDGREPIVSAPVAEDDLAGLNEAATDAVFRATEPAWYAEYFMNGPPEDLERGTRIAAEATRDAPPGACGTERLSDRRKKELSWIYAILGMGRLYTAKTPSAAETPLNESLCYDHRHAFTNAMQASLDIFSGHDEAVAADYAKAMGDIAYARSQHMSALAVDNLKATLKPQWESAKGDFAGAVRDWRTAEAQALPDWYSSAIVVFAAQANDEASVHDLGEAQAVLKRCTAKLGHRCDDAGLIVGLIDWGSYALPNYFVHAGMDDWQAALVDARAAEDALPAGTRRIGTGALDVRRTWLQPLIALALAKTGHVREAQATIVATPEDCYLCLRVRAQIFAADGDSRTATSWFEKAVQRAPQLPFAAIDWGRMLLAEGKYAESISKFRAAHLINPRFSDPMELWGEALMQKNRSDLAIAQFQAANEYAPHWGRLHLEWGKALDYVGRHREARQQFRLGWRD